MTLSHRHGDTTSQLWAMLDVSINGVNASFCGYVPNTTKRWSEFCKTIGRDLAAKKFSITRPRPVFFHAGRWIAGLGVKRALNQAIAFDQLIDANADLVLA